MAPRKTSKANDSSGSIHPPLWSAVLISKAQDKAYPYANGEFQELTGLTALGFLDPDFRMAKGKPLTKAQLKAIKQVEDQAAADPWIFGKKMVKEIPYLAEYHKIVRAYYIDCGVWDELMVCVGENLGTFAQIQDMMRDMPGSSTGASHGEVNVSPPMVRLLFGDDGFFGVTPKPVLREVTKAIHYRIWDSTRRKTIALEKAVDTVLDDLKDALAGTRSLDTLGPFADFGWGLVMEEEPTAKNWRTAAKLSEKVVANYLGAQVDIPVDIQGQLDRLKAELQKQDDQRATLVRKGKKAGECSPLTSAGRR